MRRLLSRPLPAFAAASLLAVAVGAAVCALSGVPTAVWGRNVGAWVVGLAAAAGLARWAGARSLTAVAVLAPLAIAVTLLGEGRDGVRRWLDLGLLQVNAAMLLLPILVVALAGLAQRSAWWWIPAGVTLGVLVLQPDASQATAFGLAVCVVAFGAARPAPAARWAISLVALALAAGSWMRPDPLAPVPEVEEVIGLAFALSPWLAALGVLSLAAHAVLPALCRRDVRWAGRALSVLLLVWCVAPALGAFPVPLVGVGLSPILGAWLGVGLLAGAARRPQAD